MNAAAQLHTANASRGDSPKSNWDEQGGEDIQVTEDTGQAGRRVETNVSDLVLCARCELAMARVTSPLDVSSGYAHARSAWRLAQRAGAASLTGAPLPLFFNESATLAEGWAAGQRARVTSMSASAALLSVVAIAG